MRMLLPLLLLSGCAAEPPARQAGAVSGEVSCIDPSQIVARHAEPPASIVFEMAGGRRYRNDLRGSCPGVERADGSEIVQTEPGATRLCANDGVRVYDPVEARAVGSRAFARCRLGAFTPIAAR